MSGYSLQEHLDSVDEYRMDKLRNIKTLNNIKQECVLDKRIDDVKATEYINKLIFVIQEKNIKG